MPHCINTNISNIYTKRNNASLYILTLVLFINPVIGALLIYFVAFYHFKSLKTCIFASLVVGFAFGCVAFNIDQGGSINCDIMRYRDQYITYVDRPYGNLFSPNILFDSVNWIMANYWSPNPRWIGFIWVTVSVGVYLSACTLFIFKFFGDAKDDIRVLLAFACLLIIPFVIVNELLKQTVACSFIYLSIALRYVGKKTLSWVVVILALLVHVTSTILFFPLLFWGNKFVTKHIRIIVLLCIALGMINIVKIMDMISGYFPILQLIGLSEALDAYASFNDWGGSKRFYLSFSFFILQILYIFGNNTKPIAKLSPLILLIFCVIMSNFSNNHNFARLINVLYPFNALMLLIGVYLTKRNINKVIVIFVTSFVLWTSSIIQFKSNIDNNYYVTYMNNDILKIVSSNIFTYFDNQ